jgi:tyrosine-protein kinase Etk/Wzc
LAGAFPGAFPSDLDTELQLLTSRVLIGEVIDSLGLQAQLLEPKKTSSRAIFAAATYDPALRSAVYKFRRDGSSYEVSGPDASGRAVPGVYYRLPAALVTLRRSGLPDAFAVELVGREDAIDRVRDDLTATNPGGDVIQLVFRAGDAHTAAAVPNALVTQYLKRRRTSDRGVNQRRFEFLTEQADSIAAELMVAEASLRQHQERSGGIDPEAAGSAGFGRIVSLRSELEAIDVEARALEQILARTDAGEIPARQLAAYPTFLRNAAINNLLSSLLELETRRVELLEKRTERDPDVVALSKTMDSLEAQLVALSRSYRAGLLRQRETLRSELGQHREELATVPEQTQQSTRRRRDVARLSETLLALQSQMVEARLAAISEGGDVRQIDRAVSPRRPYFPNPVLNSVGGLLAGLFFGVVGTVVFGQLRRRVYESWDAELATGVPALRFDPDFPLAFANASGARSLLVLAAGDNVSVSRVGEHLAATAALRGKEVVFTDLTRSAGTRESATHSHGNAGAGPRREVPSTSRDVVPVAPPNGRGYAVYRPDAQAASAPCIRESVEELERRFPLLVAVLPGIRDTMSISLLVPGRSVVVVAPAGVLRAELVDAVSMLNRMEVSVAGVVVETPAKNGKRRL